MHYNNVAAATVAAAPTAAVCYVLLLCAVAVCVVNHGLSRQSRLPIVCVAPHTISPILQPPATTPDTQELELESGIPTISRPHTDHTQSRDSTVTAHH